MAKTRKGLTFYICRVAEIYPVSPVYMPLRSAHQGELTVHTDCDLVAMLLFEYIAIMSAGLSNSSTLRVGRPAIAE
jgi:hypothetical protein